MIRLKDFCIYLMLSFSLILPPLLLGGVYAHVSYNSIIMVGLSLCYMFFIVYIMVTGKRVFVSYATVPLIFILIFSGLQLIPLPISFFSALSDRTAYFMELNGFEYHPLTLSAPDTRYSILRVLTLCFFCIMLSSVLNRGGRSWKRRIVNIMLTTSTFVILLGMFFNFAGIESWLDSGLNPGGIFIYPTIINPNHAAAYLGISGILALARVTGNKFSRERYLFGAIFFLHTLAVAATLSRGGILAYLLSVIFMFIFMFIKQRDSDSYVPVAALFLSLTGIFYMGYRIIIKEFVDGGTQKLLSFSLFREYLNDFWFLGSGLGSFPQVFPFYQANPARHYAQLENEILQFILEMGVVFAIPVFLVILYVFVKKRRKSVMRPAAVTVIVFIIIHNTADFNLHNFATLFPVVLMVVFSVKDMNLKKNISKWTFAAVSFPLAMLVFYFSLTPENFIKEDVTAGKSYEEAVYQYPADYTLPFNKGVLFFNSGKREDFFEGFSYISEAMAKAPDYYFLYYVSGTYLLKMGSEERALKMYSEALEKSGDKMYSMLDKIHNRLLSKNMEKRLIDIIYISDETTPHIRNFIRRKKLGSNFIKGITKGRETLFFIAAGRAYLRDRDMDSLRKLLTSVEKSLDSYDDEEKGSFYYLYGSLFELQDMHEKAEDYFYKAAILTGNFRHILKLARHSLRYFPEKSEKYGEMLRDAAMNNRDQLATYYRWRSSYSWRNKKYNESFKFLEKAAEVSGKPSLHLLLARRYMHRNLYRSALTQLLYIKQRFSSFRVEKINELTELCRSKLHDKRNELMKNEYLKD